MDGDYLVIRKDSLECPVCHNSAVDSFSVFPCSHSVCNSCTTTVMSRVQWSWTGMKFNECPICRILFPHVENERLPRNLVVQNILDSAVPLKTEFSPRMRKLGGNAHVTEKESEHLTDRVAEQQRIAPELKISNVQLQKKTKLLSYADLFALVLILLFLAFSLHVLKSCQVCANEGRSYKSVTDDENIREKAKKYIETVRLQVDGKPFITGEQVRELFAAHYGVAERLLAAMPRYTGRGSTPDTYDYVFFCIDFMPYDLQFGLFDKGKRQKRSTE